MIIQRRFFHRLTLPASINQNTANSMIIKFKEVKLKITKNENNRFWKPIGQFWNITQIKINGEWYNCALRFIKKDNKYYIQFHHPIKVDKKTCLVKEVFCEGLYKEVSTSL